VFTREGRPQFIAQHVRKVPCEQYVNVAVVTRQTLQGQVGPEVVHVGELVALVGALVVLISALVVLVGALVVVDQVPPGFAQRVSSS
jgi:hypothetical protein